LPTLTACGQVALQRSQGAATAEPAAPRAHTLPVMLPQWATG